MGLSAGATASAALRRALQRGKLEWEMLGCDWRCIEMLSVEVEKTIFCYIIKSPEISEAKIMLVSGDFYLIIVSPEIENEIINLVIY
jgi:hypothetical protein